MELSLAQLTAVSLDWLSAESMGMSLDHLTEMSLDFLTAW